MEMDIQYWEIIVIFFPYSHNIVMSSETLFSSWMRNIVFSLEFQIEY